MTYLVQEKKKIEDNRNYLNGLLMNSFWLTCWRGSCRPLRRGWAHPLGRRDIGKCRLHSTRSGPLDIAGRTCENTAATSAPVGTTVETVMPEWLNWGTKSLQRHKIWMFNEAIDLGRKIHWVVGPAFPRECHEERSIPWFTSPPPNIMRMKIVVYCAWLAEMGVLLGILVRLRDPNWKTSAK